MYELFVRALTLPYLVAFGKGKALWALPCLPLVRGNPKEITTKSFYVAKVCSH